MCGIMYAEVKNMKNTIIGKEVKVIGDPKFEDIPNDIMDIFISSVLDEILNELIIDELK